MSSENAHRKPADSSQTANSDGDRRRDDRIAQLEFERDYWRSKATERGVETEPLDPLFTSDNTEYPLTRRAQLSLWLGRVGIDSLRVALGAVFLVFGALKLVPGVSPAEDISRRTVDRLTFGLVSGDAASFLVGLLEVTIGLCLVSGKLLRFGLVLLIAAMVGVLSPLVLFTDDLFAGKYNAPTLLGQYVLKDVVLLAAAVVIIARELARFFDESEKSEPEAPDDVRANYDVAEPGKI